MFRRAQDAAGRAGVQAIHPKEPGAAVGRRRLQEITGVVPSIADFPPGCRFHTRCWKAQQICSEVDPEFIEHAPRHWAACHFPGA